MTKDELLRIILDFGLYYADKSPKNVIQVFKDADKTVRLVSVCEDEMYNFSNEQWYTPANEPIGVPELVMHTIVDYAYTPVNDRQNNEPLTSTGPL